jgi:hypothetical protein
VTVAGGVGAPEALVTLGDDACGAGAAGCGWVLQPEAIAATAASDDTAVDKRRFHANVITASYRHTDGHFSVSREDMACSSHSIN